MAKFHATVKTAEAQDRMLLFINSVPNELAKAMAELASDAALIFGAYAPKGRTGRLGRGIRVVSAQGRGAGGRFATGRQFAIVASVRGNDGFDYVGVSRFGHRRRFIRPAHNRQQASVIATGKLRRVLSDTHHGKPPALRIPARTAAKPIYRNVVRGVVKNRDWAASGQAAVDRELDSVAERLAHNLVRRFG